MSRLYLPKGFRSAEQLHRRLRIEPETEWVQRGQRRAFRQFHKMAARVPAYKDFLKKNKIDPSSIKSIKDFDKIPSLDKDNYLRKYPKEMLCWDGVFGHGQWVISTTSGSTGEPFYFPRTDLQDQYYAITAELYLRSNFRIHERSTLYIVAFPMGAWIGGLFTYEALKIVASEGGYEMSVITPGIHKQEVINAIKQLGGSFDQIIIGAYAPFLRDILDDGTHQGINWKKLNVNFVFSAEAFTEKFRDFVSQTTGQSDPLRFSLNHYGTVDLGTMSHETPETIMIRRALVKDDKLNVLFPEERKQPTFTQYMPELFYFEEQSGDLLCTAFSGIPLLRYNLKDYGGIISREEAHNQLKTEGYDVKKMLKQNNIQNTAWNLPYVYVYERNDFSVSYYAFVLYPDPIRRALFMDELMPYITGKFTMLVDYNSKGHQKLHVNVELRDGVEATQALESTIMEALHKRLSDEVSEYNETHKMVGGVVKPVVHLHPYEDPEYFRPGTKQKWVVKG